MNSFQHNDTHPTVIDIPVELNEQQIAGISQYIVSFHVVTFDIQHGAVIEYTWPPQSQQIHSTAEYIGIAGSSLHDSNTNSTAENVNSTHVFRLHCSNNSTNEYLFGYVYYCQRHDDTHRRDYMQKSIVLISHLPYIDFFLQCINIIGNRYFDIANITNVSVLTDTLHDISTWSALCHNQSTVAVQLLHHTVLLPTSINANGHVHAPSSQIFADQITQIHHSASAPDHITQNAASDTNHNATDDNGITHISNPRIILPPPRPAQLKPTRSRYYTYDTREPDSAPAVSHINNTLKGIRSPLRLHHSTSTIGTTSAPTSPADNDTPQSHSTPATPRNHDLHSYYLTMSASKQLKFDSVDTTDSTRTITNTNTADNTQPNTLVTTVNIYKTFKSMLANLWLLYELILCNEPLLILGATPQICSDAIIAAINLISPLQYSGDYRPYFTLYDTDFANFSVALNKSSSGAVANIMLGITNSQLLRTFNKVQHVAVITNTETTNNDTIAESYNITKQQDNMFDTTNFNTSTLITSYAPTFEPSTTILRRLLSCKPATPANHKVRSNSVKPSRSQNQFTFQSHSDDVQLLRGSSDFTNKTNSYTTPSTPSIQRDQHVIDSINDAVIRNHFKHLTLHILEPLTPYVKVTQTQLDTIHSNTFNPYLHNVTLPIFDASLFLNSVQLIPMEQVDKLPLQPSTLKLVRRTASQTLYAKFIKSSNFTTWYHTQRTAGQAQLHSLIDGVILKLYQSPRESAFTKLLDGQKVKHTLAMYQNACKLYDKAVLASNTALIDAIERHKQLIRQCTPQQYVSALDNMQTLPISTS